MSKIFNFIFILAFVSISAQAQTVANKVELLSNWFDSSIPYDGKFNQYNEVWGFAWKGGEYAVIGNKSGTYILDVTDAEYPHLVRFVKGGDSTVINRDFKDYKGHLYMVADQGDSAKLQILDFTGLPDTTIVVYESNALIKRCHNLFVDTSSARLYACSAKQGGFESDLKIFDISSPADPKLLLDFDAIDVFHDIYVKNDTAFGNNAREGMFVYDFTNLNKVQILGAVIDYPEKGYNHSGWVTEDGKYYFFADETPGSDIKVCDITDINEIDVVATFNSGTHEEAMVHNVLIKGHFLYVSYYHDGFRLFDISNPLIPQQVGFYDTYLGDDYKGGKGAWGVYPFLPSGNILVSDREKGLYVLDATEAYIPVDTVDSAAVGVYPNPFESYVNFNTPGSDWMDKVELFDIHGGSIAKFKVVKGSQFTIKGLDSLPVGVYFVSITGGDLRLVKKLIKSPRQ